MPKKITRAVKGQIKAERLKGKTIAEIAEAYGIAERTVQDITKKNRHGVLEEAKTMSKAEKEERIKHLLAETGMKQQEIAEMYDVQPTWVTRIAKKYCLRAWKEKEMEFKNPEGYADPTAFKAMNPDIVPGDVWEVTTLEPGRTQIKLFIQTFGDFAITLNIQPLLDNIPEGCEAKIICKGGSGFVDMSKPQVVFFNRLIGKVGEVGLNRLITVRKGVADIILRGYAEEAPRTALEAPRSDSKPELDKIHTEEEKPQETASRPQETDAEIAVLKFKAAMNEALAGRLLDIVEKAVQKGA